MARPILLLLFLVQDGEQHIPIDDIPIDTHVPPCQKGHKCPDGELLHPKIHFLLVWFFFLSYSYCFYSYCFYSYCFAISALIISGGSGWAEANNYKEHLFYFMFIIFYFYFLFFKEHREKMILTFPADSCKTPIPPFPTTYGK